MTTLQQLRTDHLGERNRGWRADAMRRIDRLEADVDDLERPEALVAHLDDIKAGIDDWQVDQAWQHLHHLEEEIGNAARGTLLLNYTIRTVEHAQDPALRDDTAFAAVAGAWRHVKQVAKETRLPEPAAQEALAREVASVLHHAHTTTDERHFAANEARQRLVVAAWSLLVLSGLVVLTSAVFSDLPFLVGTESFGDAPTWQVTLLVALGGVVGGSWGAVPAFTSTKRDRYRVQYARAGLRLAMGVFSALVGVALVGAGWVETLTTESSSALFAVAIAFGVAQEPVARILEGRMKGALEEQSHEGKDDA